MAAKKQETQEIKVKCKCGEDFEYQDIQVVNGVTEVVKVCRKCVKPNLK